MNNNTTTLLFGKVFLYLKSLIINERYEYLPKYYKRNCLLAKIPEGTNRIIELRQYDGSGRALFDIDFSHHGKKSKHPKNMPNGAHKHIWDFNKKRERSIALPMTYDEYDYYINNLNKLNYEIKYVKLHKDNKNKKNLYDKNK